MGIVTLLPSDDSTITNGIASVLVGCVRRRRRDVESFKTLELTRT